MNIKKACIIPLVVFCGVSLTVEVIHSQTLNNELVVTCHRGQGSGEITLVSTGGVFMAPCCFTVDNSGVIYIPEVGIDNQIKVHKFTAQGKALPTLVVEGSADLIKDIEIGLDGKIYLYRYEYSPGEIARSVFVYDSEGTPLHGIGPEGAVDWQQPISESFKGDITIEVLPDNRIDIVDSFGTEQTIYIYDNAHNLSKKLAVYSENIIEKKNEYEEKLEVINQKRSWSGENAKLGKLNSILAPDGHIYYMRFIDNPERPGERIALEIRRIVFPNS